MTNKLNFSLTQLEYIMAVHKFGHFAKAAEACNVTQPTLSMQIHKLEEDLGVTIFDRSKKPILLTSAGQLLIDQFKSVLFEAKKIDELIKTAQNENAGGELILGVIPTVAPYILPILLPTLNLRFQGLSLQIKEMQTHKIIEALNSDEIDVGLLATPININKIIEYPLYFEPFSVFCHKKHPLNQLKKIKYSNLDNQDIWLLEEGHCLRNQILDVCNLKKSKNQKKQFHFESGSIETLKKIVSSFGGYTLVPELAISEENENTHYIQFERPIPARQIGLVYRREHYKIELIENLGEAIIQSIPENIRKLRQKDLDVLRI